MRASDPVADPGLERQGRRMLRPALRFLAIGLLIAIPGVVLIFLGHGWSVGVGIAVLLIASAPFTMGIGLLVSGSVTRWAARHNLFA